MVLDSILEKVLSKLLGGVFYGIIKDNIKTDLLKGKFTIQNIGLHPNLFQSMNLPFDIHYSYVQKIQLMVPWRTEDALTLNISSIYAILVFKEQWDLKTVNRKKKQGQIKKFLNEKAKSKTDKKQSEEQKKSGGITDKFQKMTDNVKANISSIHLRFQSVQKGYSFGIKVEDILCSTVNEQGFADFFHRQKARQNFVRYLLDIDPLGIYVNPNQKYFLSTQKSFASITEAMAQMDRNGRHMMRKQSSITGMQSLQFIFSLTVKAKLRKYFSTNNVSNKQKFQCQINFHQIELATDHQQFHVILDLVNRLLQYQNACNWYQSKVQINTGKQRDARDIVSLIKRRKKDSDRQRLAMKKMARNHLGWVFRMTYIRQLQRKFLKQAINKQINVQNLFQNRKIEWIISKVNIKLIKQWVEMAVLLRDQYKKNTNIFTSRSQRKLENFATQYIDKMIETWTATKVQQIQELSHRQLGFKLYMNVQTINFKITKQNTFGVGLLISNLKSSLWKRQQKNFILQLFLEDLLINAFNAFPGQKNLTHVPVFHRNKSIQTHDPYLLSLKFEKNPIGKPFVFSSTQFKYNSVEVTVYPQLYHQIYKTFIADQTLAHRKNQKKKKNDKKKAHKKQIHQQSSIQLIQQHNTIEGVIHSPWIVIPLSHNNDATKQCWVLRLGDLNIGSSKDAFLKRDFYETFSLQLRHFQLKYFSSIKYFHTWLNNKMDMEIMKKFPNTQNNKIIDVIEPISCYVDLKIMKSHVKQSTKKNRQSIIVSIKIEKVYIHLPKLIVDKLKKRIQLFQDQQFKLQLIQTNPLNILGDNSISGLATVTTQKVKNMLFFVVLKNYYLYFFMKDNRNRVILSEDIRENMIRITSDHHSYFNKEKDKKIKIQLKDHSQHLEWDRCVQKIINKRDRKYDPSYSKSFHKNKFNSMEQIKEASEYESSQQSKKKKNQNYNNNQQQVNQSDSTLLKVQFVMQNLSIQLIDANNDEFLFCSFDRTKLIYGNLGQKNMSFSISEWNVQQKSSKKFNVSNPQHKIPFLGSRRFFGNKKQQSQKLQNFLNVKASFSEITGDLSQIDIAVDQLYISWDIFIFNKILTFFFFSSEADDAPTVANPDKKSLKVSFKMDRFYLYCFHDESELIALFKFHRINIDYSQNKIVQSYQVNCQKFQAQKFIDNDASKKMPMIVCRKNRNMSVLRQSAIEEEFDQNYLLNEPQTDRQQRQGYNPLKLEFHVRKRQTQKYQHVKRLRNKFGSDVMVSEMKCSWKDTIIYFEQQQTFRLLNFFLNQILGTVTSKFKKRQFSENYIEKALNIKKISTFDAQFNNLIVLVPPHQRNAHFLQILIDQIKFCKNIRPQVQQFQPYLVSVDTKRGKAQVFYDTIVFDINGINPFYKYGSQRSIPVASMPLNLQVSYSKLNFPRQYEPILQKIDAIDKTVKTKIRVYPSVKISLQKIFFVTFLQIFYQNIKHRDGKAHMFQTPQKYPPKKEYKILIQDLELNMYQYRETKNVSMNLMRKSGRRMSSLDYKQQLKKFQKFKALKLQINYQNIGAKSDIKLQFKEMLGSGELPMKKFMPQKKSFLALDMASDEGQMTLKVKPVNYQLQVNLDNLTQVLQFINYDSEYVSNKIMPKKKTQSWQNISIFPEGCGLKMKDLEVLGTFCINYLKQFKNPVNEKVIEYLIEQIPQKDRGEFRKNITQQISDKQIKVNGQDMSIFMKGQHIGDVKNLFFSRLQLMCKLTQRRFKKQTIHIGGLNLFASLLTLKQLFGVYQNNVKKSPYFKQKIYFQPFHSMPAKKKNIQKRITSVEFDHSCVHLIKMPESLQKNSVYFEPFFIIQFMIPKIVYSTYMTQQQISINDLHAKVLQAKSYIFPKTLIYVNDLSLNYTTDKSTNDKQIQIHNPKNIIIHLKNINEKLCANFGKQIKRFNLFHDTLLNSDLVNIRDSYNIGFINLTKRNMEISIKIKNERSGHQRVPLQSGQQQYFKKTAVQIFTFLNLNTEIGFQQDKHGPFILKKLNQIRLKEPTQLFSNCALKYEIKPDGVYFNICENNCLWNVSTHPCWIYLFNKNQQCVLHQPFSLEPKQCKFFSRDNQTVYIMIQPKFSNKQNKLNRQQNGLIKLNDIPIQSSLNIKPYHTLNIKGQETRSGRDFMKLIIFNKYKLNNYLPISVQINFSKIRPFSTSTINIEQNISNQLVFTLQQVNKLILDSRQIQIRKDQIKKKKIEVKKNSGTTLQLIYLIRLQISNCQLSNKQETHTILDAKSSILNSYSSGFYGQPQSQQHDPSSDYYNMLNQSRFPLYQIMIKMSTSQIIKNNSCCNIYYKFCVGNKINDENCKTILSQKCLMIPQNVDAILLLQSEQSYRIASTMNLEKLLSKKLGDMTLLKKSELKYQQDKLNTIVWNSFVLQKIKYTNSENISIINDLCLIDNKTNLKFKINQSNTKLISLINPKNRQRVQLIKSANFQRQYQLDIQTQYGSEHVITKLPLQCSQPQNNIIYWAVGVGSNTGKKMIDKDWVESAQMIIKITILKLAQIRYHLILQESEDDPDNENMLDSKVLFNSIKSSKKSTKKYVQQQFGYRFYNQLPKGYILTVIQQNGILPSNRSSNFTDQISERDSAYIRKSSDGMEIISPKSMQNPKFKKQKYIGHQAQNNTPSMRKKMSNKLQIGYESPRSKINRVQYSIKQNQKICLGFTNLQMSDQSSRSFTLQFYLQHNNIEFPVAYKIRFNKLPKIREKIVLSCSKNIYSSESIKNKDLEVSIYMHKKKQGKFDIYIRPTHQQSQKSSQKMKLNVRQISCTIQLSNNAQDSITLQLQNFLLNRIKKQPSSHQQHVKVRLDKILLRQNRNLPIIQMLDKKKSFFKGQINLQKTGYGQYLKLFEVRQAPLHLNIREGILFKILSRVIDIKAYYFDKRFNNIFEEVPSKDYFQIKDHKAITQYNSQLLKDFQKIQKSSKIIFIRKLDFEPTNIYFSYKKDQYSQYQRFVNEPIIKYFVLIPGISQLKVCLPSFQKQNYQGTTKQLTKGFAKQIKKNIGSTIFSSLSSISLFDSPVAAIDGFFQYTRAIFMIRNS